MSVLVRDDVAFNREFPLENTTYVQLKAQRAYAVQPCVRIVGHDNDHHLPRLLVEPRVLDELRPLRIRLVLARTETTKVDDFDIPLRYRRVLVLLRVRSRVIRCVCVIEDIDAVLQAM